MTNRPSKEFGGGKTGIAHLLAAGRYSLAGARVLAKESAALHEVLAFAFGLVLLYLCGANFGDYLVVSILFLILMSTEALNTSIEYIVDFVSPEKSDFARAAKDLGSLAIFFNLCAGGAYLLAVLARTFGWIEW
ncbi:MAG: diacylglycerol kinase [Methyloligellaceae bacterium]